MICATISVHRRVLVQTVSITSLGMLSKYGQCLTLVQLEYSQILQRMAGERSARCTINALCQSCKLMTPLYVQSLISLGLPLLQLSLLFFLSQKCTQQHDWPDCILCSAMTAAVAAWPMLAKSARAEDAQGVASSRMSYSRFLVSKSQSSLLGISASWSGTAFQLHTKDKTRIRQDKNFVLSVLGSHP